MMDNDDLKDKYEEDYADKLSLSFEEWMEQAPQTEDEAYARLDAINQELEDTYEEWYEATGDRKDELEEYRDRLKTEYDLIEDMYNLENEDD